MRRHAVPFRPAALAVALFLCGAGGASGADGAAGPASAAEDLAAARRIFEANLDAIRRRDRDAYLATYLNAGTLAKTGPEGIRLGYADHAAESASSPWPDLFEGIDLRLVPVAPGIVYGTYRYRVRYGEREVSGLSERLFVSTPAGWKIAVTSAFEAPPGTPPPPRALAGATLIDGTGAPPVRDAVVLLRDGKIECAGTRAACPVPAGVETLDLDGQWIAPGLVDAHVHFSQTGWVDGRPDALDLRDLHPYEKTVEGLRSNPDLQMRAWLCSGVTAVFDVGGYPWTWDLRSRGTDSRAPHVAAAGPLLSTRDHWLNLPGERQFVHLKDAASAREGVRWLASRATDAVKVWFIVVPDRPFEEQAAAVAAAGEAARQSNLPLIVHATGLREAKEALRAGAKLLVHSVWDLPVDEEFLSLAKKAGALYNPTLTVRDGYSRLFESALSGVPPVVDDPGGCVDAATREKIASTPRVAPGRLPADARDRIAKSAASASIAAANLRRVRDAGIPIAMGTDAGNPLTLAGPSVFAEMEAMEAAGMTPMEVLVASTRNGALAMGRGRDLGTVEAGKIADLIVVGADPLVKIANLRTLRRVVRGGVVRDASELRAPPGP